MSSLIPPCQRVRQRLLTLTTKALRCPVHVCRSRPGLNSITYSQTRCISSTAQPRKPSTEHDPLRPRLEDEEEDDEDSNSVSQAAYESWLAIQGRQFKYPGYTGPKWLGGSVPFPLNPTFKPPPPLSDKVRTLIYKAYTSNPASNDPRSLSIRYGISIPRVEAILRLKVLEAGWPKENRLQTGFQVGMESLLGVKGGENDLLAEELNSPLRDAVKDADNTATAMAAEAEEQTGKKHISRTYFEPVDEGQLPIVSTLVAEARSKVTPKHDNASPTTATPDSHVVQPDPKRPAFRFVDVGLKWFDPVDAARRQKESLRRKKLKERGKGKKMLKQERKRKSTV